MIDLHSNLSIITLHENDLTNKIKSSDRTKKQNKQKNPS